MLALSTITIFMSAALLFLVQPMFAKQALPLLGGAPAVWNTCMAFFQAALLAGYGYAHLGTRWLGVRRHAAWHCVLLLVPLAVLPIGLPRGWDPPTGHTPVLWLLALLAVSVGAPFFVISTTAPLVQRWFAESGHRSAGDPYFLYAASNLGSMLALLGYPALVEPNLRLGDQTWLWSCGYAALVVLTIGCAIAVLRKGSSPASPANTVPVVAEAPRHPTPTRKAKRGRGHAQRPARISPSAASDPVTWRRRMRWLALSAIPSSWLLGVTTHLTTDIAPAPLLWIVPLAIYLLSFILVFARRPLLSHAWMVRLLPVAVAVLVLAIMLPDTGPLLLLHLGTFFIGIMACHGELAADRPAPAYLTEFYFWMSAGGVLGGAFNGLVAPVLFPWTLEYPLAVVLACRLCPWPRMVETSGRRFQLAALAALTLLVVPFAGRLDAERPVPLVLLVVASVPVMLVLFLANRPRAFALAVALPLLGDKVAAPFPGDVIFTGRGYFGVHRVIANEDEKNHYHHLVHGSTLHGRQCRDPSRLCEPLTYYHRTGPLGLVFEALQATGQPPRRVAVVGLGAGATACYAEPGWEFTFYEIDPLVKQVAETSAYFSFLEDCAGGKCPIVLGDGRLKLAEEADGTYGVIVLDAFSSDAVPIHMLTREAIEVYLAKSTQDGLLVFNTTNNHLDLEGVLRDLAADAGLVALACRDLRISDEEFAAGKAPSTYVVLARRREDFQGLETDHRWRPLPPRAGSVPWSDDFSNVVGALKWW